MHFLTIPHNTMSKMGKGMELNKNIFPKISLITLLPFSAWLSSPTQIVGFWDTVLQAGVEPVGVLNNVTHNSHLMQSKDGSCGENGMPNVNWPTTHALSFSMALMLAHCSSVLFPLPMIGHHWLSGGPLSVRFPHLFRLSDLSDIFVAEAWRDTIEVWDLHFRRNFIGSEILEWASLTVILALVRFPMVPGSWKWTIDSSTSFTVNLH
ncbi:hypothetical protein E6C27_scaffold82G00690 [Cucumis melo var. makuwa]|uniref:Uncharacterized protein n=1 Tax=Cucumis melo var. makuwa TaxID=1194695 RepID=A0A5A7VBX8_CUCMM|nr:hypothetical protein E6C27_scaffold82G00690 [Cucumis melo var. makuwa]